MSRKIVLTVVAIAALALAATPAFAGKPGGGGGKPGASSGGSSSFSLILVEDANGNGVANYADKITFSVTTTATTQPYVSVTCRQGGVVVYGGSAGYFDGYPWPWTRIFSLSSSYWTGGAADCTAELYLHDGRGFKTLATKSFTVAA